MRERNRDMGRESRAEDNKKRAWEAERECVPGRRNPLKPEGKEDKAMKCSII